MKRVFLIFVLFSVLTHNTEAKNDFKVLYWNIQNGMWCGQNDNYDAFVGWVKKQNPDVCVWCEAQSIYLSGTDKSMSREDRYLVENWGELALRYGHKYWAISGYRDSYPQVITSKYPIIIEKQIVGNDRDSIVTHGAGWYKITVKGKTINFVSLHTWPQKWGYMVNDKEASAAAKGGDKYRRMEMEYICKNTIGLQPESNDGYWMMMGDFNSTSRRDNYHYLYPEDDTRFLVHDFILGFTPYIDIVGVLHYGEFVPTTGGGRRIDFVYCSPALFLLVKSTEVISDEYTEPVREPNKLSNFWIPSDHRPIITVINL